MVRMRRRQAHWLGDPAGTGVWGRKTSGEGCSSKAQKEERDGEPAEVTGLGRAEGTLSQGSEAGGVAHGSPVAGGTGSEWGGAGAAGQTGGAPGHSGNRACSQDSEKSPGWRGA